MSTVRVRPADGLRFRHPETLEWLPAEGLEVQLTPAWRRALSRGDVVRCEPPRPQPDDPQGELPGQPGRGGSTSSRRK